MHLIAFDKDGTPTIGVRRGEEVVDLSVAAPELPRDMPGLLAAGPDALARAAAAAEAAGPDATRPLAGLTYLPPVWNPPKIVCIGLNYTDHAEESGAPIPDYPPVFVRYPTTLVAHNQPLVCPKASHEFDYEAELVVVIGKGGRNIPRDRALDHVAGYSAFNEGSVRDYQFKSTQWAMGKNFDATGGFGPELVTADELPPGAKGLRIACRLNGETLQDSNTERMIFDVATLIAEVSAAITLEPGDIFVTGTPPGVGFARDPQVWMKPGDVCEIEIEGIGTLVNPIVAEA